MSALLASSRLNPGAGRRVPWHPGTSPSDESLRAEAGATSDSHVLVRRLPSASLADIPPHDARAASRPINVTQQLGPAGALARAAFVQGMESVLIGASVFMVGAFMVGAFVLVATLVRTARAGTH